MTTTSETVGLGKRLLENAAAVPAQALMLVPYGRFGDWQIATIDGRLLVTTEPRNDRPVIYVGETFLQNNGYVVLEDIVARAQEVARNDSTDTI